MAPKSPNQRPATAETRIAVHMSSLESGCFVPTITNPIEAKTTKASTNAPSPSWAANTIRRLRLLGYGFQALTTHQLKRSRYPLGIESLRLSRYAASMTTVAFVTFGLLVMGWLKAPARANP